MHAALTFATLPLYLGALLSDWAYAASHEVQWANFASWLIGGGLLLTGLALLWAVLDQLRSRAPRARGAMGHLLLLVGMGVLGFINALVHAQDGWAMMPVGPILSAVVLLLTAAASAIGLAALARRTA